MYWILFVMGAIAAIVIALVVGGLATPRAHVVARTTVVPATPDAVWAAIRDSMQQGSWSFAVTAEDAPRRLDADTLDDYQQTAGNWTWELQPARDGTRITITERGSTGNPVARFIGTHFLGHKRSLDRYLRELAQQLGVPTVTIDDANAPASTARVES